MMGVYDLARDLGVEILKEEIIKKLLDAKNAYEADPLAVSMIDEYNLIQKDYQLRISKNDLTAEEQEKFIKELTEKGNVIKENPITSELIKVEAEFNQFMNSVINIITQTIAEGTGEGENDGGCNPGACASCGGGCHK